MISCSGSLLTILSVHQIFFQTLVLIIISRPTSVLTHLLVEREESFTNVGSQSNRINDRLQNTIKRIYTKFCIQPLLLNHILVEVAKSLMTVISGSTMDSKFHRENYIKILCTWEVSLTAIVHSVKSLSAIYLLPQSTSSIDHDLLLSVDLRTRHGFF